MSGLFSTCFFVSATSNRLACQSGTPITEIGEISTGRPPSHPSGFYREVPNGPTLIVEIELIYRSKLAIRGSDREAMQILAFLNIVFAPRCSRTRNLGYSRSTGRQDLSGLKRIIWRAKAVVFIPRSFP